MNTTVSDRIEKSISLRSPRSRVWRAISESGEFGAWFGVRFPAPFEPGASLIAEHTDSGSTGDLAIRVVALEPETYFAYRWRPHDMSRPVVDDSETTLVEFFLKEDGERTSLRILESGFESIPDAVRPENYRSNLEGWDEEAGRLAAYVDVPASDRIERSLELRAPLARVWAAVSQPEAFGKWFGLKFEDDVFVPGAMMAARITEPPEHAGTPFTITVAEVQPPTRLSFRWHPYDIEGLNPSAAPATLIEFILEPRGDRTFLTVTESGFDSIPEKHRVTAFRGNDEGWSIQVQNIRRYLNA